MNDLRPLILWMAPRYPPDHLRGAEQTAHAFNRYLMASREILVVVASSNLTAGSFEGVECRGLFDTGGLRALTDRAGVVCGQLDHIPLAARLASACKKPVIYFVHNAHPTPCPYLAANPAPQLVVYNAHSVREQLAWPMHSVVAYPPVDWRHYRVATNRECVTLVTVEPLKGSDVFFECARQMPARRFLGSLDVASPPVNSPPSNVELIPGRRDARDIYARTRILLMPSIDESWGRAGVEAMASGIPVIAHPTPGLRESLGTAGIFKDRDDIRGWIEAITRLDDPAAYHTASQAALRRARELHPAEDLERVGRLVDTCLAYDGG